MSGMRLFGRRQRRWLSIWQVVAMLFMQLAVAAYVCPAVSAATLTPVPDCAEHGKSAADPAQPQLCKAHGVVGDQVVGGGGGVDATAAPPLLAVLDWRAAQLVAAPVIRAGRDRLSGAPPPGAPRLYLALLVLRQ
jgi:hypothetical protein